MKWEDRLKAQMPQNRLASVGMMCTYCDLGPCVINPFDQEPQVGACGIDAENMNYVNLGMKVIKGLNSYKIVENLPMSLDNMLGHSHAAGITAQDLIQASKSILKSSEEQVAQWHSEQRKPHEIEHGVGVLEKDAVNVVVTAYEPEMIKVSRSQKMRKLARDNDARRINLVGALCGGAEASYNHEIPLLGGFHEIEEAADMIDYVYGGGDATKACEKAVENYSKRDKTMFRHFTPKRYSLGHTINKEAINEAQERTLLNGVVALMGCDIGKCQWDIDELVRELAENDFMVINLNCSLRAAEPGTKAREMTKEYGFPSVMNGGCCEPGKVVGLHNLTVLMPGWRSPRLLTTAFAFASENIPVILGTMPFLIPEVRSKLMEAGISVEPDSSKIIDLLR